MTAIKNIVILILLAVMQTAFCQQELENIPKTEPSIALTDSASIKNDLSDTAGLKDTTIISKKDVNVLAHMITDLEANVLVCNEIYKENIMLEEQNIIYEKVIIGQNNEALACKNKLEYVNNENDKLKDNNNSLKRTIKNRTLLIVFESILLALAATVIIK